MIIDEFILIKGHSKNLKHYRERGYEISVGETIMVKSDDVTSGSTVLINCKCDNCGIEKKMEFKEYFNRTKSLIDNYYCFSCRYLKIRATNLSRYGVDNPMKSNDIKERLKISIKDKYGVDHYSKTDEYKIKYKSSCISKYGVDNASKSDIIKDLISNKKFSEYNSIEKYNKLIPEDYRIISYNRDRVFSIVHSECCVEFNIFIGTLYDRIRSSSILCTKCNPVDQLSSGRELEVKKFIESNGFHFIENSYGIIPPMSLDIYIPNLKIGFEFNGVYWNSELFKNKNYHINKTIECEKVGIKLMHIWEDDWVFKKDIVKSIIRNKLGLSNKIYARNCELKVVNDVKLIKKFLNDNHIQGYSHSSIKIGLYYKSELVSLMTFGKKRKEMELVRFCNKLNTNVVGGASKLFNYFIRNYKFDVIESFSDNSMFDGRMYSNLGFDLIHNTPISYHWVVDGIRKHRFSFNKKVLVNRGHDSDLSESQIMLGLGYYRIWECGMKKWLYKKN